MTTAGDAAKSGSRFAEQVQVEKVGDGRYRAFLSHDWDLLPLPQGGIVAAFGLRASEAEIRDPSHRLRSMTAVFAGKVAAGELEIEVEVLRHGRSASQVHVKLRNAGETTGMSILAVFGSQRPGPAFVDLAPPEVPPPLECRSFDDPPPPGVERFGPTPFWSNIEARLALGHFFWDDYEPSRSDVATWIRFREPPRSEDGTLDPLGLVVLADRMPSSIGERIGRSDRQWFAPSADLTMHFFEPMRTEWVLAHDRARWADDGWASAETELWDENGTLVGYGTQMMVFTYL
jgi:acyl-CoA thioesterase